MRKRRVAWGVALALTVMLLGGAGVGLHFLRPGDSIQVGSTTLSYGPTWHFDYWEARKPRTGVLDVRVLHAGPVAVVFYPPSVGRIRPVPAPR